MAEQLLDDLDAGAVGVRVRSPLLEGQVEPNSLDVTDEAKRDAFRRAINAASGDAHRAIHADEVASFTVTLAEGDPGIYQWTTSGITFSYDGSTFNVREVSSDPLDANFQVSITLSTQQPADDYLKLNDLAISFAGFALAFNEGGASQNSGELRRWDYTWTLGKGLPSAGALPIEVYRRLLPSDYETKTLETQTPLPAIAGYNVGDIINVNGVPYELVASTTDPHTLRGTAASRTTPYLGSDSFEWQLAGGADDVNPLERALLSKAAVGASPPAVIYVDFHDARGYTARDLTLSRNTTRDTATEYAYDSLRDGVGIDTPVGTAFTASVFSDPQMQNAVTVQVADRWELLLRNATVPQLSATDIFKLAAFDNAQWDRAIETGTGARTGRVANSTSTTLHNASVRSAFGWVNQARNTAGSALSDRYIAVQIPISEKDDVSNYRIAIDASRTPGGVPQAWHPIGAENHVTDGALTVGPDTEREWAFYSVFVPSIPNNAWYTLQYRDPNAVSPNDKFRMRYSQLLDALTAESPIEIVNNEIRFNNSALQDFLYGSPIVSHTTSFVADVKQVPTTPLTYAADGDYYVEVVGYGGGHHSCGQLAQSCEHCQPDRQSSQ